MEKTKFLSNNFLFIISALIVIYKSMPVFAGYFGAYPLFLLFILGFVFLFPMKRSTLDTIYPTLVIFLIFMIFQCFVRIREDSFLIHLYNILQACFVIVLPIYLIEEEKEDTLVKLFWIILVSISITEITTLINVAPNSVAARMMATGLLSEAEQVAYARLNIGGFGIAYLSPVITSLLFMLYKNKKFNVFLLVVHIFLTFAFIIQIQYTLALLMYFITICILLISGGNPKKMVIVLVCSILLIPLLWNPISDLFSSLADTFKGDTISQRFNEIAQFMSGSFESDSDVSIRIRAYERSFRSFIENFLAGGILFGAKHGGHSAILDFLAVNGLLGGAILFFTFRSIYTRTILLYKDINGFPFVVFAQVVFFVFALINPAFYASPLMYLLFLSTGACIMIKKEEKTIEDSVDL